MCVLDTGSGSAFVEMQSADALQSALTLNGNKLMGRPIKLNAAPPRPTDVWPPAEAEVTAGKGGKADAQEDEFAEKGGAPTRSPKPFEYVVGWWFSLGWTSVRFGSVRFCSVLFCSVLFGLVMFVPSWCGVM